MRLALPVWCLCAAMAIMAPRPAWCQADSGENLGVAAPAPPLPPLSGKERFRGFLDSVLGPATLAGAALSAGFNQATDRPLEWEHGMRGYGMRLGDNLATTGVRGAITYGTSALLGEDNRYRVSGRSRPAPRIGMALATPFLARNPEGRLRISISRLAGTAGASVISRQWEPASRHGSARIAKSIGFSFAGQAAFSLFREFFPRRVPKSASPTPAPPSPTSAPGPPSF